jgi:hypothetical protein
MSTKQFAQTRCAAPMRTESLSSATTEFESVANHHINHHMW